MRVSSFPTQPTLVFSSFYSTDGRLEALRDLKVDAIMDSFWSIRKVQPPERVFNELTWPVRRYLDSGIFTLMMKAGTHRVSGGARRSLDFKTVCDDLLADYIAYLKANGSEWDHVVEIDTDNIPNVGPSYTLEARDRLHEAIGDKLMPVWHWASESLYDKELGAWRAMVRQFPYVAVGGDKSRDFRQLRRMVKIAHSEGVLVHGLAQAGPKDFQKVGYDTGDSTSWIAGIRHATFTDFTYSNRKRMSPVDLSKARAVESYIQSKGFDPQDLIGKGKPYVKFYISIARELERQQARREGHAGNRFEATG